MAKTYKMLERHYVKSKATIEQLADGSLLVLFDDGGDSLEITRELADSIYQFKKSVRKD